MQTRVDYEVDYSRSDTAGFETTINIEKGPESIDGLALMRIKNPHSNV